MCPMTNYYPKYCKKCVHNEVCLNTHCDSTIACSSFLPKCDEDGYINRKALLELFEEADTDIVADYGELEGCDHGFSLQKVREIIDSMPFADAATKPEVSLIGCNEFRNALNKEYLATKRLIESGEIHLDNLAEGFAEADRVYQKLFRLRTSKVGYSE